MFYTLAQFFKNKAFVWDSNKVKSKTVILMIF